MVETKVITKEEYVTLVPPVSTSDYEGLKQSIKEHGGLLIPIILNQDNVVLDGHHILRACMELGIPVSYRIKDFTNRPLDELKYVVAVNLRRRHLDEFQRAEVAIKYDKLYKRIARERYEATQFNSKTAQAAVNKRHKKEAEDFSSSLRGASGEADRSVPEEFSSTNIHNEFQQPVDWQEPARSSQQLADEFGVSHATIERVRTILEQGTPEQIQSMRDKSESGQRPGVRTMYEQVQDNKLKSKLQTEGGGQELKRDNLKLINKDFRTLTRDDIPDESADLVLVPDFPEPRITEDQGFRIYEQLMKSSCDWLKDGGMLAMHVEQRYLPRAICERPPGFIIALFDQAQDGYCWRPVIAYVKGVRDTQPTPSQKNFTDSIGAGQDVYANKQELATEMIKRLSPIGSVVVDPFMGQSNGTVGMAAVCLGRTYIGIERETTQFLSAMIIMYDE